jgi:uncharacterized protein (DUF433 family)
MGNEKLETATVKWQLSKELIERNPDILSGTPVFRGTRVSIQTLFDYLQGGDSLDEFLDDFPSVTREQAIGVLEFARQLVLAHSSEKK